MATMMTTRRSFLRQVGSGAAFLGTAGLSPHGVFAEKNPALHLPRSAPEAQGVASAGIAAFLDGIAKAKHELHSFMLLRHGQVVAEGWWQPYGPQLKHTMYSMSKSFTSTAVGFAVTEGKLTMEDPVISFFPKDVPEKIDDKLAALKVKHLLTMSVGNEKEPTFEVVKQENWVKAFLAAPIVHDPGSVFQYNSAATYMLSAIVQHLTGQKIIDYLKPRLFDPLVIEGMTWETCPRGINTGGWGLSVRTEDLAKFGQLYLQKGQWYGKQLLPANWVEEATTFKIQQPDPAKPTRPHEQNDWLQGYCYQFWRSQHHAFRGDGAFGQFTVVIPEKDAVVIMTGEDSDLQGELDLVWEHLLPAMKDAALPEDVGATEQLRKTLQSLKLPVPEGKSDVRTVDFANRTYAFEPNSLGLKNIAFSFSNEHSTLSFRNPALDKGDMTIRENITGYGSGRYNIGRTTLPGTPPRIISGGSPPPGTEHLYAATYAWKDEHTLEILCRYVETPHHDTITCQFAEDGNSVKVTFLSSVAEKRKQKDTRPVLVGKV